MSYSCIKPVVLLVEDNLLLLLDARMALEDEGYTVIEAVDAQDALAQLRDRDDIVAIISDVVMPGPIDGLALATIMRARRPDLPIVLTSGSSGIGVPPPGVPLIAKPYRASHLARHLAIARDQLSVVA